MELESSLQRLRYEVISIINTGEKTIKNTEEEKPDLILMDIRIKGELDGIEVAEIIRNRFGIPVIFSTAYLDEERIERAKITMPFGYVLKPIQQRDLEVTIEIALYTAKIDADRKRIENNLRKSEGKFRTIIENSKGIIFMIDQNGYFSLSEGAALSGLGLEPGQVVGMDVFEVYKGYPEITTAFRSALAGETVHDPHLIVQGIQDKRHFDIFYSPSFIDGELTGALGEAIDITYRIIFSGRYLRDEFQIYARAGNEMGLLHHLGIDDRFDHFYAGNFSQEEMALKKPCTIQSKAITGIRREYTNNIG